VGLALGGSRDSVRHHVERELLVGREGDGAEGQRPTLASRLFVVDAQLGNGVTDVSGDARETLRDSLYDSGGPKPTREPARGVDHEPFTRSPST
jgi:hypothetical protein